MNGSAWVWAPDKLAALLEDLDKPTTYDVDELLRAWRDAQREATDAYAGWRQFGARDGHPAYVAALDREERAAEVYAEVQRRVLG